MFLEIFYIFIVKNPENHAAMIEQGTVNILIGYLEKYPGLMDVKVQQIITDMLIELDNKVLLKVFLKNFLLNIDLISKTNSSFKAFICHTCIMLYKKRRWLSELFPIDWIVKTIILYFYAAEGKAKAAEYESNQKPEPKYKLPANRGALEERETPKVSPWKPHEAQNEEDSLFSSGVNDLYRIEKSITEDGNKDKKKDNTAVVEDGKISSIALNDISPEQPDINAEIDTNKSDHSTFSFKKGNEGDELVDSHVVEVPEACPELTLLAEQSLNVISLSETAHNKLSPATPFGDSFILMAVEDSANLFKSQNIQDYPELRVAKDEEVVQKALQNLQDIDQEADKVRSGQKTSQKNAKTEMIQSLSVNVDYLLELIESLLTDTDNNLDHLKRNTNFIISALCFPNIPYALQRYLLKICRIVVSQLATLEAKAAGDIFMTGNSLFAMIEMYKTTRCYKTKADLLDLFEDLSTFAPLDMKKLFEFLTVFVCGKIENAGDYPGHDVEAEIAELFVKFFTLITKNSRKIEVYLSTGEGLQGKSEEDIRATNAALIDCLLSVFSHLNFSMKILMIANMHQLVKSSSSVCTEFFNK